MNGVKIGLVALLLVASALAVVLYETEEFEATDEYQTYYADGFEHGTLNTYWNSLTVMGNGDTLDSIAVFKTGNTMQSVKTATDLTSTEKWDTSKPLRLPGNTALWYTGIIGNKAADCKSVTVQLKVGQQISEATSFTFTGNMMNGFSTQTIEMTVSGVTMTVNAKSALPSKDILSINPVSEGTPTIDFLKVTDQSSFQNATSPIEVLFTIGQGDDARTNKIIVEFGNDSTEPTPSDHIGYVTEIKNGYTVMNITCDDTYAGSNNYILIIAKYAGSIVYNSYVEVPSSVDDYQRVAFSNTGLEQIIIEIVSGNEAFGDNVPGYLAFVVYEPN